ncbi:MAG: hypothetical protein JWM21_1337 [Acidobacteria bacterium]|nr:hypothetical protein [Acidobacteriota bacterium]
MLVVTFPDPVLVSLNALRIDSAEGELLMKLKALRIALVCGSVVVSLGSASAQSLKPTTSRVSMSSRRSRPARLFGIK